MLTPCHYFPLEHGRYEVKPGLFPLTHDFGNAAADQAIFQLDRDFNHYRDTKLTARKERMDKYIRFEGLGVRQSAQLAAYLVKQLCKEYPDHFSLEQNSNNILFQCSLTGEILVFDRDYKLLECTGTKGITPAYMNTLDAIFMQLQEDVALVELTDKSDRLTALHLCFPNHWAAEDKIGRNFITVHEPVPGMKKINQRSSELLSAMLNKGPFVRFAWGLATDNRLNKHPSGQSADTAEFGYSSGFNPAAPELYLRVQRQVIKGFTDINLIMFTIRTYLYDINVLRKDPVKRQLLISALQTMSPESQSYKGIRPDLDMILDWL